MSEALSVVVVIVVGLICFIAGMVIELFINSGELKATRDELFFTKAQLSEAKKVIDGRMEIVEIDDKVVKSTPKKDYFKPW